MTPATALDLSVTLAATPVNRDVVRVSGPDATGYLQGQLSQDVGDLDVGATAWSFVLQPTGKVDAWLRVTRTAGDGYVLDVDGGAGEALEARLRRFLLRTRADVERLSWRCVALRGPGAEAAASEAPVDAELRVPAGWPGVEGADLLGPDVTVPPGVAVADPEAYEALRITAGVPAMGAELSERTIPAEAGQWIIDASVDFTKGCFTGQELVARIDSRGGNVPRHLRGLVLPDAAPVPPGARILVADSGGPAVGVAAGAGGGAGSGSGAPGTTPPARAGGAARRAERDQAEPPESDGPRPGAAGGASSGLGREVGEVTSSSYSPSLGVAVALAYVGRAVAPPTSAVVVWPGGQSPAEIRALPLVALTEAT